MYSTVKELEEEVKMLEEQQEGLVKAKEEELVKEMTAARLAAGLPVVESELRLEANRKVGECLTGDEKQGKRGYSLTKVDSDQNNNNNHQDQVTCFHVGNCLQICLQGGAEPKIRKLGPPENSLKSQPRENLLTRSDQLVDPRMLQNSALWEIQRVQRTSIQQGMAEKLARAGFGVQQVDQGGLRQQSNQEKLEKAKNKREDASMLEHINRQIEKSMRAGVGRGGGGNPPSAAPVPTPPSAPYSESRLTQVDLLSIYKGAS